MATKYLAAGSITFASPAWSGGAIANTDDLVIAEPFGIVAIGLNQSALAGLESVWIKPTCTAGRIGGGASGSFLVDVDNSTDAFVANQGGVELYIAAAGPSGKIENLDQSGPGSTYITAGTVDDVTISQGRLTANGSAVIVNLVAVGGSSMIEYNATAITSAEFHGGNHTVRRAVTTLTVSGGATVVYDPDDAATITGTTIVTRGGRLVHRAGATPTVINRGGTYDLSQARISFTPGGTSWTAIGTRITQSTSVPITNLARVFGSQIVASDGPVPI